MSKRIVYLDNAATSEVKPEVLVKMMPYFLDEIYNPSALYSKGIEIRQVVENARNIIAQSIGAKNKEIYFTSGGSESNCWAIQGFVNYWLGQNITPVVVTSVIEHKSILECVNNLPVVTKFIHVDNKGFVDLEELKEKIVDHFPTLVSIQYANNEIGTVQHIKQIAEICHKKHAIFHTDAVQAYGHIYCDVNALDIDMLSASGHKFGAVKGSGFLYIKQGVQIKPLIYGTQNFGMRGGTENVPYIVGMATAAESIIKKDYLNEISCCKEVRDYAIDQLVNRFHVTLNGDAVNRLPNNINVTIPSTLTGESLIYMLDSSDIYISAGSACNSHIDKPSYVLKAIGLSDDDARRTIRISLNEYVKKEHIDYLITEIDKAIKVAEINEKKLKTDLP